MTFYSQVIKNEGPNALFRGAGVNVVRGVAGAGVLSGEHLFHIIKGPFKKYLTLFVIFILRYL
jgi:hypothetical protein